MFFSSNRSKVSKQSKLGTPSARQLLRKLEMFSICLNICVSCVFYALDGVWWRSGLVPFVFGLKAKFRSLTMDDVSIFLIVPGLMTLRKRQRRCGCWGFLLCGCIYINHWTRAASRYSNQMNPSRNRSAGQLVDPTTRAPPPQTSPRDPTSPTINPHIHTHPAHLPVLQRLRKGQLRRKRLR